jgi:5-methylcytosine-specific restriction enzyme A
VPSSPPSACSYPGCPELTHDKYCDKHKDNQITIKRTYTGDYKRGWPALRLMYLRNNPLCKHCRQQGIATIASEVDHIVPIALRPELRLTWSNLQSLCKSCHSKKTVAEQHSKVISG